MNHKYVIKKGSANPLGATLYPNGVNFSVFSPEATAIELLLFAHENDITPIVIPLDNRINKSFYYWHIFIEGLEANQLYGFRVDGEYNPMTGRRFDKSKVLTDPYSKALVGNYDRGLASEYGINNIRCCLKSAVIDNHFDWEDVEAPNTPLSQSVIYEMHVGGFTKNPNSGLKASIRGTYMGVVEKIPYLKKLGITAIELLPVYFFDNQDAPYNKTNYWGYSPISFFAPHSQFSSATTPQGVVNEFKTMIRELHRADIEVILDVVYNHTAETDYSGPTYNLRGFSNYSYYITDDSGHYKDYSGCGNSLNANHSVVRRMITQSLEYWVSEMKVDGFRFDLASILSRDENGEPMLNPPILWSIESNPVLVDTKLIAEPWDATGLYQVANFTGDKWAVWNANYRDDIRKFVKSSAGMIPALANRLLGSYDLLRGRTHKFKPDRSIHFVTCHDGFTLYDLVSYNEKHNLSNGEANRDGSNNNESWNCGAEGATRDAEIIKLRKKQMKNFLSLLFLSQGTPMLLMGDEVGRTQQGNNNAYCQDNEISWFNWDNLTENAELFEFSRKVIKLAKNYKKFNANEYLFAERQEHRPYLRWHGIKMDQPDWGHKSRTLAVEFVNPLIQDHIYIILNAFWENVAFELPKDFKWMRIIDTSEEEQTKELMESSSYLAQSRSIAIFKEVKDIRYETLKATLDAKNNADEITKDKNIN